MADVEIPEFREVGYRRRDGTHNVRDVSDVENCEEREVSDGGRDRVGFGEVEVGEVEVVDTVGLGVGVT